MKKYFSPISKLGKGKNNTYGKRREKNTYGKRKKKTYGKRKTTTLTYKQNVVL